MIFFVCFKHADTMQLQEWPVDSKIFPVMLLKQPAYAIWLGECPYKSVSGKTMQLKSLSWDLHKLSFWASGSLLMVFSWEVRVYLNDLH